MEHNLFYLKHNNDETIPITDGIYETDGIPTRFRNGQFIIVFFDANGNLVTPTAGSIKPEMATYYNTLKQEGQWLVASGGDVVINASDVIAGSAEYTPPLFCGPSQKGRMRLSNIAGADHCKAFFWRTV